MAQTWNISVPDAEAYSHPFSTGIWKPITHDLIQEVAKHKVVAIDTETTGLSNWRDLPLGWSLAFGNRRIALDISTLPYFAGVFADPDKTWVLANAKFDMHMLANVGAKLAGQVHDVCVQHALLFPDRKHALKSTALHILNWTWRDFQDTFGKINKENPPQQILARAARENPELMIEYMANDAWGTLGVYRRLTEVLKSQNTFTIFDSHEPNIRNLLDYFLVLEAPYTRVLWEQEREGVLIDVDRMKQLGPGIRQGITDLKREIAMLARDQGYDQLFEPTKNQHISRYLYDIKKYPVFKQTKGGKSGKRVASTDAKVIERFAERGDVVCEKILEFKKLDKLYGTYFVGLSDWLDPDNRIHTSFNQDVARCMPAGELVLTNRGYLPVEQVSVGDQVIAHTGIPRRVVETSKHAPKAIYSVTLSNCLTLRTTANHQYLTNVGWKRADELLNGDTVIIHATAREQWRTIPGWTDFSVSSWGRVANNKTGRFCTQRPKGKWGHLKVCLYRNGAQKRGEDRKDFAVHKLVLSAFAPDGRGETRHLDGIAWNNNVDNLSYGTSHENRQDALKHGSMSQRLAGRTKLSQEDVAAIRAAGSPGQPPSSTSKLSYAIAEDIRVRYAAGEGRAPLARAYGVSYQAVDNIIRDKTWTTPEATAATANVLAERYGVAPGTIRDIWAGRRWQDQDYIEGKAATFGEATVCMVVVHQPEETYGLTVEIDHSHVTGGIVTHNTGRLSSSEPNIQNIPNAERDKYQVRAGFIAPPRHRFVAADYGQIEMRLLAAASQEDAMIQVFLNGWDIHMGNAAMMKGVPYDDIVAAKKIAGKVKDKQLPAEAITQYIQLCIDARSSAKTLGFGLVYGMGDNKLANSLKCTLEEAIAKKAEFQAAYPAASTFAAEMVEIARQTGATFTLMGRRRDIPDIVSSRRGDRMKAERIAGNTPIQGGAAEVLKWVSILWKRSDIQYQTGARMTLQVHDELTFECPDETVEIMKKRTRDLMEKPFNDDVLRILKVPFTVDINSGDNWASAK